MSQKKKDMTPWHSCTWAEFMSMLSSDKTAFDSDKKVLIQNSEFSGISATVLGHVSHAPLWHPIDRVA